MIVQCCKCMVNSIDNQLWEKFNKIKSVQGQGQDYSIVLNPLRVGWNSATPTTRQTNVYFIEPVYYIC